MFVKTNYLYIYFKRYIMIYILSIITIYFINFLFKKKALLINNTGQPHQTLSEENNVPLTGGIFLIIFF